MKKITLFITLIAITIQTKQVTIMEKVKEPKDFIGDNWERNNAAHNGVYDNIHYSGDIDKDFDIFVFKQGGGKSADPKDKAAQNMPPKADKDSIYYHTVDDITWTTYSALSGRLGYDGSATAFYDMADDVRSKIVHYFRTRAQYTKSELVNTFLAKVMWGSGRYMPLVELFEGKYGCIHAHIFNKGEYDTFYLLLRERHEQMKGFSTWGTHGRGWTSGLAHFHRIFKWYSV